MGIVGKISIEINLDSDRMLEIIKILLDRGFKLDKFENGLITNIVGSMELNFEKKLQILTFQSR